MQCFQPLNTETIISLSIVVPIAKGLEVHSKKLFEFEVDLEEME